MKRTLIILYWLVTAATFALGLWMSFGYAPREETMGDVQRIFYLHLPVAINTFLACFVVFIAAVGYLWQRSSVWDDLADAAARVAVLFGAVVLLTGMIWGHSAWGVWWTWSPRLTFSLALWLLYVVYLVLRSSIESRQKRAMIGSVYALIAFLDVPLVYFSTRIIPEIHPTSVTLEPQMKTTLAFWFLPVTLLCVGLIVARFRLARGLSQALTERSAA